MTDRAYYLKIISISAGRAISLSLANACLAQNKRTIQIKGSDTMVNLGQAWAEEFNKRYPDVNIAVTGGGSGTGIAALISGTCDICESSRAIEEKERKKAAELGIMPHEEIVR